MNIVCPSCSAVYAFDPARIPSSGKKVQCSQCNFVFVVRPPEAGDSSLEDDQTETMSAEAVSRSLTGAERIGEGGDADTREAVASRRLILRQDGTRYSVKDMMTLQRWIVERRITREADLSEDGETWERIGDRADLANFFEMVERSRTGSPTTSQVGSASTRVSGRVEGVRVVTTLRPRGMDVEGEDEDYDDEYDDEDEDEEDDDDVYIDEDEDEEEEDDDDDVFELDDEDEVLVGAGITTTQSATPVFTKSQLLGQPEPEKTAPVVTAPAAAAPTPAQQPEPEAAAAVPQEEEDKEDSQGGVWLVAALILIVGGLGWYFSQPGDSTPPTIASNGGRENPDNPVGPVGPPLGPDGQPIVDKPPPTPTAKKPTPAPTAAPTAKPTPAPTAAPTKAPKPRTVASGSKKPRQPTKPVVTQPALSPREAADKKYEEGLALKKAGDLTGAIAAFQLANQMQPTPLFYEEMGFAYLALHDAKRKASNLQDAETSFRNAVARDGRRAASYLGLGWVYRRQNRIDDAIRAVDACLLRNPDPSTRLEAEGLKKALEERKAMGG